MIRPMTIKIVSLGLKEVTTSLCGTYTAAVVETTITDDKTGEVINRETSHLRAGDTITIPAFWNR